MLSPNMVKQSVKYQTQHPTLRILRIRKYVSIGISLRRSILTCHSSVAAAYFLNSGSFVMELQKLLEVVQDLVGIDSPSEWMRLA
jgi:hypothetical protein